MLYLFISMFWALVCPDYNSATTNGNGPQMTTMDTGGETGHVPPYPPPPPPKPQSN